MHIIFQQWIFYVDKQTIQRLPPNPINTPVELSAKEASALFYFLQHPSELLTKEQLFSELMA